MLLGCLAKKEYPYDVDNLLLEVKYPLNAFVMIFG